MISSKQICIFQVSYLLLIFFCLLYIIATLYPQIFVSNYFCLPMLAVGQHLHNSLESSLFSFAWILSVVYIKASCIAHHIRHKSQRKWSGCCISYDCGRARSKATCKWITLWCKLLLLLSK